VNPGQVNINGGLDLVLSVPEGQTTGFTLQFELTDNNSCQTATSSAELTDYELALFRTTVGTSTCTTASSSYNPNNCYPSEIATTTWNLSCTASSTSCTGPTDTTQIFNCSFPLWYVADPTSGGATNTVHFATDWSAAIRGIDDDGATSSYTIGTTGRELLAFLAYSLDTLAIPYGSLEPGNRTDPLVATTSFSATGNVGLDQRLSGEAMCNTYTTAVKCQPSATSTIPENKQVFATSSITYLSASTSSTTLSSTTQKLFDLNVPKSTSTVVQQSRNTFWGIEVPASITFSGLYTGENTFIGVVSDPSQW
jgi:hypothetical protein